VLEFFTNYTNFSSVYHKVVSLTLNNNDNIYNFQYKLYLIALSVNGAHTMPQFVNLQV